MIRLFWQAIKVAPVLFAASLFASSGASAQTAVEKNSVNQTLDQINNYQQLEQDNQSQVTNVNQLRDVSPTDWAYEALRSLVDRYGCIAGFPNQTYRGSQALTRYEFAAGLNSCLNQIERLIASQGGVDQETLDTITRLTQEFEAELATIGGRVDELESRTAVLEDSQFSTTTKLNGEAIFAIADAFGGGTDLENLAEDDLGIDDISDEQLQAFVEDNFGDVTGDGVVDDDDVDAVDDAGDLDDETTFSGRVRLNFDTSFFGDDLLNTRLEAGNVPDYGGVTNTNSARLGFDTDNDFDVDIDNLWYRFPFNERVRLWVGPQGLDLDDIFNVTNPMLESSGTGALSRFNRRNPVLFRGTEGAGAGANVDIIPDRLAVNFGYLTDDAFDSDSGEGLTSQDEGLFNGSFSAGGQVVFNPIENLELSGTYVRSYQTAGIDLPGEENDIDSDVSLAGDTGSIIADNPFIGFDDTDVTANRIGAGVNYNLGERIVLAGFGGYADVEGLIPGADNNISGDIWTWGANVSFLDLGKEGSVLALAGGQIPKFTTDEDIPEDTDTSYIAEALYKFPLNENILITPGAYAVFNPNSNEENDTVYVGVIRTTFSF